MWKKETQSAKKIIQNEEIYKLIEHIRNKYAIKSVTKKYIKETIQKDRN